MSGAEALRLPQAAHLPGSGSAPDLEPLEQAKAAAPARTDPRAWEDNLPYCYGWRLFDARFYWEAHEVWEAVWLACRPNSRERLLLRVLIQLANARLKRAQGRENAVARLCKEVKDLLAEPLLDEPVMAVNRENLEEILGKTLIKEEI
ncbi:DUF309 domain-containing protein [Limibacillus halophilus]